MKKVTFYLYLLFSFAISLLAGYAVYSHTWSQQLQQRQQESTRRLVSHSQALVHEVDKYGLLPMAASNDEVLLDALYHPTDFQRQSKANAYLKRLNNGAGALQSYLVGDNGNVIASSNWDQPDSFVGRNLSYRPYIQQARANRVSTFYAVGTTGNTSGYFLAIGVYRGNQRLGVVAIKIGLEQLELLWHNAIEQLLMSDSHGVVVLSTMRRWKYHSLEPLSATVRHELESTQQYNKEVIKPPIWRRKAVLNPQAMLVEMGSGRYKTEYLAVSQTLPVSGMTLTMLNDTHDLYALALTRALTASVIVGFMCLLLHAFKLWQMSLRAEAAAKQVLQEAHDHLEEQVEQRSAQLRAANDNLKREIEERIQAAKQVQQFQNELIRTENLAVIGQLSTGLAHEINQPLAALAALSVNAVRFLEINDTDNIKHNLERIVDLVTRLGDLTVRLKSFARRPEGERESVSVGLAIDNALFLLNHRLKKTPIQLHLSEAQPGLSVWCDAVRLEQVLVNLISNAIDAQENITEPGIAIQWEAREGQVVIQVRDNGPGLSDSVKAHIFEPFFTTKKTTGLGLGLALSSDIIKVYGGQLTADNHPQGGAVFTITLQQNKQE